jgi:large repetitive protein
MSGSSIKTNKGHDGGGRWARRGATRGRISLAILALAIGCWLAFGAGQASASHVSCGDTITTDTKLDSDLVNCPSNGIAIGADNITLDLNGYTIDGDGELKDDCAEDEICDIGVLNDGHSGVTIEGGSVREFAAGVIVFGASQNSLRHLSVSRNAFPGAVIADSPRARFEHSVLAANGLAGIYVFESPRVQFEHNAVVANGLDTDQAGVDLFASPHSRIAHNSISANGDIGVFALEAEGMVFEANVVIDHPEAGFLIEGDHNVFTRNRLSQNGVGIDAGGDGSVIARNHVFDSAAGPPDEPAGVGIWVGGGDGVVVEHNVVERAERAGIFLSQCPAEFEGCLGPANTVVRNNQLRDNSDGIFVWSSAEDTLLVGNHAVGSEDDGIDVDSAATTLTGNHAVQNGDLGIEAVAGVTDGGGNKAHGNGNPAQCTNVACN